MSKYIVTIGLEIHAELRTKTKMFCSCKNDPDEKHPNLNICPVCTGHPGTLPVMNKEAVGLVQRVGLAVGGEVQKNSHFDRKNYFYPDLPKGYQISQYQHPLVWGGTLNGIRITRVHLEEDTARSIHEGNASLVDFNRSGIPLMELVTEPDITSAEEARAFAEELQLVLQYLGASDANMEKGQMRCEANVSIAPAETRENFSSSSRLNPPRVRGGSDADSESKKFSRVLGTKVEVKNINSFSAVEKAIQYELKRQAEVLDSREKVKQETRGWDETKGKTFSQRSKESSHDYRYFPEPDLPPLEFSEEYIEELRSLLPELPAQKRKRLSAEYGITPALTEILVRERSLASFWEHVVSELLEWLPEAAKRKEGFTIAANYFTSDLLGLMKEKEISASELLLEPENFAELIKMIVEREISSRVAKDVLRHMVEKGGDPSTIVKDQGLAQVSNEAELEEIVKSVLLKSPAAISDYKNGKANALQYLVGQVMKETKGTANPTTIRDLLIKNI